MNEKGVDRVIIDRVEWKKIRVPLTVSETEQEQEDFMKENFTFMRFVLDFLLKRVFSLLCFTSKHLLREQGNT